MFDIDFKNCSLLLCPTLSGGCGGGGGGGGPAIGGGGGGGGGALRPWSSSSLGGCVGVGMSGLKGISRTGPQYCMD